MQICIKDADNFAIFLKNVLVHVKCRHQVGVWRGYRLIRLNLRQEKITGFNKMII